MPSGLDPRLRIRIVSDKIAKFGHVDETIASIILRLGEQHPLVRERDAAVSAYRHSVPWQYRSKTLAGKRAR
jgi:hypothetical protein